MPTNSKNIPLHLILLAWLVSCITLFLYASRMGFVQIVSIPNWRALFDILPYISLTQYIFELLKAVIGILIFSLSCISLGLFLLRKFILADSSKVAFGLTAFLIGEILFSLLFLTTISLYRLNPIFVAVSLLVGFFLGLPAFRGFILPSQFRDLSSKFKQFDSITLILILLSLFLGLLLVFTRLSYDATAEYFSQARIMAVSQLPIFFYPSDSFVVSSFHPGILFTANIQLFGDQTARMLSWVNGMVILLLGLIIGKELGLGPGARLSFLVLMVTSTAFIDLLGDGKIELITTAPILAAIYWLVRSLEQPTRGTMILIGFLSGFAIISRPYNIFLVSLFIAFFFISQAYVQYSAGRFHIQQFISQVGWIVLPIIAWGIFHLFQNWVWLKSPLAPLTYARELKDTDWQWVVDPANLPLYRVFYPITLTFLNSQQSMGNISPLLIGFLPFLLIKDVRNRLQLSGLLGRILLIASITLLAWITISFAVLEIRYVLFLWVILFLIAAKILDGAIQYGETPLIRPLLILFLVIMCVRTALIAVITYFPNNSAVQSHCPDSNLCKFMDTLNKTASPGDRVFILHAYRYYLRPDLFACSSQEKEYGPLQKLAQQNPADFWSALYQQGFRYIMFEQHLSEQRYHFGKLPSLSTVPSWMRLKVLYSNSSATQLIYKIDINNQFPSSKVTCEQTPSGIWRLMSHKAD